jgi:hypothetical protein
MKVTIEKVGDDFVAYDEGGRSVCRTPSSFILQLAIWLNGWEVVG